MIVSYYNAVNTDRANDNHVRNDIDTYTLEYARPKKKKKRGDISDKNIGSRRPPQQPAQNAATPPRKWTFL